MHKRFEQEINAKKKFFDTELENLERQQKQQVEKMEQDHAVRRREEAKRIRLEQERDYGRFQEQLRLKKKEVRAAGQGVWKGRDPSSASPWQQNLGISLTWEAHVQVSEPLLCRLGSRAGPALWSSSSLAAPAERQWGSRMAAQGGLRRCHQQGAWVLGGQTRPLCPAFSPGTAVPEFGLKPPSPFPCPAGRGRGRGRWHRGRWS